MVGTTLNPDMKAGSKKERRNYDPAFSKRLALASCKPGMSGAWLAPDHGINANVLHKWRRQPFAVVAAAKPIETPFLPVTITQVGEPTVVLPKQSPSARHAGSSILKQVSSALGVIEIKFGGAIVRIEGLVDTAILGSVLRHFQP